MGMLEKKPEERINIYQATTHDAFLTFKDVVVMKEKRKERRSEKKVEKKYSFNIKTLRSVNGSLNEKDNTGDKMIKQETISSQQISAKNSFMIQETNSDLNFSRESFEKEFDHFQSFSFKKEEKEEEEKRSRMNFNRRHHTLLPIQTKIGRNNRRLKKSVFYQQSQLDI